MSGHTMSDIVQDARNLAEIQPPTKAYVRCVLHEAAAEIERLRQDVQVLKVHVANLEDTITAAEQETP